MIRTNSNIRFNTELSEEVRDLPYVDYPHKKMSILTQGVNYNSSVQKHISALKENASLVFNKSQDKLSKGQRAVSMRKSKKISIDRKTIKQVHKNLKSLYDDLMGEEQELEVEYFDR